MERTSGLVWVLFFDSGFNPSYIRRTRLNQECYQFQVFVFFQSQILCQFVNVHVPLLIQMVQNPKEVWPRST